MPHLKDLYAQYKDDGLVLIGVHSKKGGSQAHEYAKAKGIDYPICVDSSGSTVGAYGVNSYPDYYVIDRNGVLRYADLANSHVDAVVAKLLAEPAPGSTPLSRLRAMVAGQPDYAFRVQPMGDAAGMDLDAGLRQTFGEDAKGPWLEIESVMVDRKKVLPTRRTLVRVRADEGLTLMRHRLFLDGKLSADLVLENGKLKGRAEGQTVLRNVPGSLSHELALHCHGKLFAGEGTPKRDLAVLLGNGRISGEGSHLARLKDDSERPGVSRIAWNRGEREVSFVLDFDPKGTFLGMRKLSTSKGVAPLGITILQGESAETQLKALFPERR